MRGDQRLAKAEPAITGRDLGVGEDLEVFGFEPCRETAKQVNILKRSPAQADPIECGPLAQQNGKSREDFNQAVVEPPADEADGAALAEVFHQCSEERFRIDDQSVPFRGDPLGSELMRRTVNPYSQMGRPPTPKSP